MGHLIINGPILIISFGLPTLLWFLTDDDLLKMIFIFLGFLIGIALSWLLWSFLITKWRVWAFNKVEEHDLLLLKKMAIKNKLIWDDGSVYEKTEIRSNSEKEQILKIEKKIFDLKRVNEIKLNLELPDVYGYKLSKLENIIELLSMFLFIIISILALFTDFYFLGVIIFCIVAYSLLKLKHLQYLFINRNYFELSRKGIRIGDGNIIFWNNIENIRVDKKNRKLTIEVDQLNKTNDITLDLWRLESYNYDDFNEILKVFINRYIQVF